MTLRTWRAAGCRHAIRAPDTFINHLLSLERQYFSVDKTRPVVVKSLAFILLALVALLTLLLTVTLRKRANEIAG
jgi:hypothetical protein